jgi:hypothetical protein
LINKKGATERQAGRDKRKLGENQVDEKKGKNVSEKVKHEKERGKESLRTLVPT